MPPRHAPSFLSAPPRDLEELADFPELVLRAGAEIHRIHSAELGAWYFNAEDTWRFDPCSVAGLGACHLAERPVACLLEIYKGVTVVDEQDVAGKAHFTATIEADIRLADCCAPAAGEFGVNGEIHTTTDYDLTQAWAAALARAGFVGMRYFCRSDPAMSLIGYALFDTAGQAPPGRRPAGRDIPISEDILREAEDYGLRVRPTP
ncbi:MAG TPA: RES domain-containing protein [Solirubrobacteraceae bacterium]|nr:RES domain-containing protein [Solirubrobacteraceae bacterium]